MRGKDKEKDNKNFDKAWNMMTSDLPSQITVPDEQHKSALASARPATHGTRNRNTSLPNNFLSMTGPRVNAQEILPPLRQNMNL